MGKWRRYVPAAACVVAFVGCGIKDGIDKVRDLTHVDAGGLVNDVSGKGLSILEDLFPSLSTSELVDVSLSLSLDQILALRDELDAARRAAKRLSDKLITTSKERVQQRESDLADLNGGYPDSATPVGRLCTYRAGQGSISLSGVFDGDTAVSLDASQLDLRVDGVSQPFELSCVHSGQSVDIVFLIDITGSMSGVIKSVRDSVVAFVDALEQSGVEGTVGVVTFQDTVGVDVSFQQPAPEDGLERSPFFEPVALSNPSQVQALRDFVNRLEANRGDDIPENLSGAIDFARNSVIGYDAKGKPNVIGQGDDDPPQTQPFPSLTSDRQVFVALTDATFHSDDRDASNSSLRAAFVPRDAGDILRSLQQSGTVVHVSDPSWVDATLDPGSDGGVVDSDYWAVHTGGVGEDVVAGYSIVDLELIAVANSSGLLDITLDRVLASSCRLDFTTTLSADAEVALSLTIDGKTTFDSALDVVRL